MIQKSGRHFDILKYSWRLSQGQKQPLVPTLRRALWLYRAKRFFADEAFDLGLLRVDGDPERLAGVTSRRSQAQIQRRINPMSWSPVLSDKGICYRFCEVAGVPVPRRYAIYFRKTPGYCPDVVDSGIAMEIVVEKAQSEHLDAIFRLLEMANMHYIPSEEMPELTYENYYVALAEGQVVGFCGFKTLSDTEAKTELTVVNRGLGGHGIGVQLQRHRMNVMCRRGIRTLTTNCDLPDTIQWYKTHFGSHEVGTLKKLCEFGCPDIDHWTTLQVELG